MCRDNTSLERKWAQVLWKTWLLEEYGLKTWFLK
jgi:hypothetical protein